MPISREDLEAVVRDGLVADIFRAERAIALLQVSGTRASEINGGKGNFGELFGAFQGALTTEAILAIARLHDQPSKRFPTRCLKGVLELLSAQHKELPTIKEPYQLELSLRTMDAPPELLAILQERPAGFAPAFAEFAVSVLEAPERTKALADLKAVRDKSLAHNEHVAALEGPTWNALIDLVEVAKWVVGALGWAYFSTAYHVNGEYLLSNDAKRPSLALGRLLNILYLSPAKPSETPTS